MEGVAGTELTIEKLVYGGDGLARDNGRVVLLPFVLPGERVTAELTRSKNDLLRGRLTHVDVPAPERVEPPCPYFFRCGGCQYQHAPYEYQLAQKSAILQEVLRRIGQIEYGRTIETISADHWHYRNRTQLHISGGRIGYYEHGSHTLCPIDHCPISSPRLNEAIARLSAELPRIRPFDADLELFTNETELQFNLRDRAPADFRALLHELGTSEPISYEGLRVSRNSFFQVNRFLIDHIVSAVIDGEGGRAAIDLYAGVGLFTLPLARAFEHVTAIEIAGSAFHDLKANAESAGLANIEVRQETADAHLLIVDAPPDLIVADPPRAGLGKMAVNELLRIRAPRIVIVSCDPTTLARDLKALLAGGYSISKMTLIDLFPQTSHLETVVRLDLLA
ncbi:MAG TPA: class I SAM-dependent RNA methyltransferase [Bryobacteraceae bacterium]|jgi:23S rRNA (uracil1939-C5)-methyltransferase|nr:class I SAM-dependent RNA methyltransferase [Bryobacteraceae bacterium]